MDSYNTETIQAICNVCAAFDFQLSKCEKIRTDDDVDSMMQQVRDYLDRMESIYKGFRIKHEATLIDDVCAAMTELVSQMLQMNNKCVICKPIILRHQNMMYDPCAYVVRLHPC